MYKTPCSLLLTTLLMTSNLAFADEISDIEQVKTQLKDLQEMTQTLIDETSDLRTGFNYTIANTAHTHSGLGAAASKVYFSTSPLSIGGYGEMYYANTNFDGTIQDTSQTQVKRLITYIGYKFDDNTILNTEIEYEGGGVTTNGSGDEVVIEFMYIDFLQNAYFNARVGNFLIPLGLINEKHEPTLFTTVQRPQTAYYLIPTTWNESGAMIYGNLFQGIKYKVAAINALQPDDTAGAKWLRKGRGGSFKVLNPSLAGVLRIDYGGINGLLVGASLYKDSKITMWDAHFDYEYKGAKFYATLTKTKRRDTTATQVKEMSGGYINASFDILSLSDIEKKMLLFIQYESVNPQEKLANGIIFSPVNTITTGINFFPHEQVVLKMDYAMSDNEFTDTKISSNTLSISLGFIF
ncbi:porin [Sulfurimonas sp.]